MSFNDPNRNSKPDSITTASFDTYETEDLSSAHIKRLSQTYEGYGNYVVFGKRNGLYRFTIGPHWHISIFGFLFFVIFSGGILKVIWSSAGTYIKCLYIFLMNVAVALYIMMFLSNPGIISNKLESTDSEDLEDTQSYTCKKCRAIRSQKAFHCYDCGVCIEGYDHHCIWVGKCVGAGNLRLFYCFVAVIPSFFMFVMFMTFFLNPDQSKK